MEDRLEIFSVPLLLDWDDVRIELQKKKFPARQFGKEVCNRTNDEGQEMKAFLICFLA